MNTIDRGMIIAGMLTIATAVFNLRCDETHEAIKKTDETFDHFSP